MSEKELNSDYWGRRYRENDAAWDVGEISLPLKNLIDNLTDKNLRILIPGAGNSYEGEYLLEKGFTNVTILDYAPEALTNFKKRVKNYTKATLVCADFFEHRGTYDLIIEQTFFCALNPILRQPYAEKMHQLLDQGGRLTGLLFTTVPNEEGPPFGGSANEYRKIFEPLFTIEKLENCLDSIKPRAGRELFFSFKKK